MLGHLSNHDGSINLPGSREWGNDFIADANGLDGRANLDNGPDKLVPHDEPSARGLMASIDVKLTMSIG